MDIKKGALQNIIRLLAYIILLALLSINVIQYLDLKKARTKLSIQIDELKKINKQYREKIERRDLQKSVAKIRELEFLKPIIYSTIYKKELKDIVKKEFEKGFTGIDEKILKKFGFIKPNENVLSGITDLYNEQVQGMYDEETGEMVIVKGVPLSGNIQKMFLVHELTHALQDQNFKLKSLPLYSENDDKVLACLSLIEGDATVVMFQYYKEHLKIYNILWDMLSYLLVDQSKLRGSPYYIRENLLFPYKWGIRFISGKTWDEINEEYKNPPESTEQIMHPEKYPQDKPIDVTIPETMSNWNLLGSNTMGEFNIRVLFSIYFGEYESALPSGGWGGDKWQVWENSDSGELRVIWYTIWDTKKDADEFYRGFRKLIGKRHKYISEARIVRKDRFVKLYW